MQDVEQLVRLHRIITQFAAIQTNMKAKYQNEHESCDSDTSMCPTCGQAFVASKRFKSIYHDAQMKEIYKAKLLF
jgi:hypothetical protein